MDEEGIEGGKGRRGREGSSGFVSMEWGREGEGEGERCGRSGTVK